MANDSDWVADVRRWYFSSQQAKPAAAPVAEPTDVSDIGCEAAYPARQSRPWPDAARSGFAELK